jgi:hypothetical protein
MTTYLAGQFAILARTSRLRARLKWRSVAAVAIAASTLAGGASASPYNPGGLESGQLGQIAGICRSVMGLHPSEPPRPVWGAATNPDLTGGENYYQGCIASLSTAQQRINTAYVALRADADCRARGMSADRASEAQCVLRTERAQPHADGTGRPGTLRTPVSDAADGAGPARSFYDASWPEKTRREEAACASLGLNPAYTPFGDCVKDMKDTFYSIANPQG